MSTEEAKTEAKKRWERSRVAFHDGMYCVGYAGDEPGSVVVCGAGLTWEEAFEDADKSKR